MSTGIAIFVTTNIYSETIYNDVSKNEKLLQQSDNWIIKSRNGRISEDKIKPLLELNIFHKIYPKSERFEYAINNSEETFLVKIIGIDLLRYANQENKFDFNKSDQVLFLASNFFEKGQFFKFKDPGIKKGITIDKLIPNSPADTPLLITDISEYQNIFSDYNWIDELEVKFISDMNESEINKQLKKIDANLVVINHRENIKNKQSLSDAFLVNLRFFSLIALIISVLLIYQFYRFILIERENEFSKLRAVGMSNINIFMLLVFELTLIGIFSAAIGLLAGTIVSIFSLDFILKTVNRFYYTVNAQNIFISTRLIIVSISVSLVGCYLAGLHPVLRFVDKTDPKKLLSSLKTYSKFKVYLFMFISGSLFLLLLFAILNSDKIIDPEILSVLSLLLFSLGSLLILPFLIGLVSKSILKYIRNIDFKIKTALSYINLTLVRQCFYILSLGILIGFVISLVIFISSFRQTINDWIVQVTPANMYIQSSFNKIQQPFPISNELFESVRTHPFVKKYDYISRHNYSYSNVPLQIRASKLNILKEETKLKFKSLKKPVNEINENWVLISEPFQKKYKKNVGDIIEIVGDKDKKSLEIMGVFYDYITERGSILIDVGLAEKLFIKNEIHGVTVYDLSTSKQLELENEITNKFPGEILEIQSKKELREKTLRTFDKTFRIVWFLAILASVISIVTIINSSSMVFLERLYEFTQLRAIGASASQLFSFLWSQMLILTLFSLLIAYYCSAGFIFIIDKINWAFFGWSIDIVFDWKPYVISSILLFILTFLTIRIPFNKSLESMKFYSLRNE